MIPGNASVSLALFGLWPKTPAPARAPAHAPSSVQQFVHLSAQQFVHLSAIALIFSLQPSAFPLPTHPSHWPYSSYERPRLTCRRKTARSTHRPRNRPSSFSPRIIPPNESNPGSSRRPTFGYDVDRVGRITIMAGKCRRLTGLGKRRWSTTIKRCRTG